MWNFFSLKREIGTTFVVGNYLLKLPDETSICRYGTQALCVKGSLLWNKISNKCKKEEFKSQIKQWQPTIAASCKICK